MRWYFIFQLFLGGGALVRGACVLGGGAFVRRGRCPGAGVTGAFVLQPGRGGGDSLQRKGWMYFVQEKNSAQTIRPALIISRKTVRHYLLGNNNCVFQRNGAQAHEAKETQDFLRDHCPGVL